MPTLNANKRTPSPQQPPKRRIGISAPKAGQVFLSIPQACARYGITRATYYRWLNARGFPRPIRFSSSCARIPLAAIEQWEAEQQQARG